MFTRVCSGDDTGPRKLWVELAEISGVRLVPEATVRRPLAGELESSSFRQFAHCLEADLRTTKR
jgi:hypothetical protein